MTFTKERLIALSNRENVGAVLSDEIAELARIALASLEAEPVGYFYADKPGDWYQLSDGDRVPGHRRIPLYANPQSSPVVKLPNEFISSEGIVVQIEKLMAVLSVHGIQYERKGNACRAAMLQGAEPVRTANKLREGVAAIRNSGIAIYAEKIKAERDALNSPVIPDGWVMVPVEPTEEMNKAGWAAMNEHDAINPTYRAMLAAAPDFRETPDSSTSNCRENAETSTNCPCCGRKPLKNRKCSVVGCEGRHVAHGLCQKHYDIEHKNNLSRRQGIREANKKYRARKSAAPLQEAK